jgi:hypothetical protein
MKSMSKLKHENLLNATAGRQGRESSWFFFVLFYAILANIPFWLAKYEFHFFHAGWFCLEYAFVGLLALYLPRKVSALLLFAAIAIDTLCAVCETYYLSPVECLRSLNSMHEIAGSRPLNLFFVCAVTLLTLAVAAWFPIRSVRRNYRKRTAIWLIAFICICLAIDGIGVARRNHGIPNPLRPGHPLDSVKLSSFGDLRLTRRTTVRLALLLVTQVGMSRVEAAFQSAHPPSAVSAADIALDDLSGIAQTAAGQPNIVLVLVESWGLDKDAAVRAALTSPYLNQNLLARYQVRQGTVSFFGPTVEGEGRELCSSKIGFHLLTASNKELQSCLPDQLAARGYHNVAVHGLDGNMFSRLDWYKHIGFREVLFRDQFRQQALPDCVGAFTGTCDAALAGWIGKRLGENDATPDFIYWVTLNSHLPVPVPSPLQDPASCSFSSSLEATPALCSWFQLEANVQNSVVHLALTHLSRPTVFIVVGDHAPPFGDATMRNSFSDSLVPYVLLIPRR